MYKRGNITKEAKIKGIPPKRLMAERRRKNIIAIPHYTEMELYILQNFDYRICAQFINGRTLNALKIKQWRLKRTK